MESVLCKIEVYSCRSAPDARLACCSKTAGFLCDFGFELMFQLNTCAYCDKCNTTLHRLLASSLNQDVIILFL